MRDRRNLSDAELEIMEVIWVAKSPVTSSFIKEKLSGKRDWALSTLMTVLNRLIEKGVLQCDRSTRTNLYSASITEQKYKASESRDFLEKLYGNSLKNFVAGLIRENSVNDSEIRELKAFLDSFEEE